MDQQQEAHNRRRSRKTGRQLHPFPSTRVQEPSRETNRSSSESEVTRRCHYCKKKGHLAKECRKAIADKANESGASKPKTEKSKIRCYNCQEMGHIAAKCPSKPALFTEVGEIVYMNGDVEASQPVDPRITRSGTIEGKTVEDIVLDTGCARTMVRRDLVPQKTE